MIDTIKFYEFLKSQDVNFFTGVPDSLLKQICSCISDKESDNHIIAANEGNAVGLATGYHLATGKVPLVYLQNSGLGNTVNPLISLASDTVYSIPMLLMIGWRGEPGVKDEPQHINQGAVTEELLKTMDVNYEVLSFDLEEAIDQTKKLLELATINNKPTAILIRKDTFSNYSFKNNTQYESTITRETVLEVILKNSSEKAYIFSTTGKTSREVFELREKLKQSHNRDFLTVGSMGHTSSIALAFSKYNSSNVICIDGDGALLMHMGSLPINSQYSNTNFKYILINNYAHESVGGQKTIANKIDFLKLFDSVGFKYVKSVSSLEELTDVLQSKEFKDNNFALEVLVKLGSRSDLGRPTISPQQGKKNLMGTV